MDEVEIHVGQLEQEQDSLPRSQGRVVSSVAVANLCGDENFLPPGSAFRIYQELCLYYYAIFLVFFRFFGVNYLVNALA